MVWDTAADGTNIVRHAAMFCQTADELVFRIDAFVREGVSAGQAALVASAAATLAELRSRFRSAGEQITWVDLAGGGGRPGRFTSALLAFAERHRGQSVRCVQEPGWHTRPASELSEALRHEALVNLALASSSASVLCAFPGELAEETQNQARRLHPAVFRDGQWQASGHFTPGSTPWRESGEPLTLPPAGAPRMAYRDDLRAVRRFVASRARELGLAPAQVPDIVLAVSELAANTRAHTSGMGQLTIWAAPGEVICQVDDPGHIADPLAGVRPSAGKLGGGQGLRVVHQIADLTEIRSSAAGTTIRLHMRVRPELGRAEGS